jgi:hypothetical protein
MEGMSARAQGHGPPPLIRIKAAAREIIQRLRQYVSGRVRPVALEYYL